MKYDSPCYYKSKTDSFLFEDHDKADKFGTQKAKELLELLNKGEILDYRISIIMRKSLL